MNIVALIIGAIGLLAVINILIICVDPMNMQWGDIGWGVALTAVWMAGAVGFWQLFKWWDNR